MKRLILTIAMIIAVVAGCYIVTSKVESKETDRFEVTCEKQGDFSVCIVYDYGTKDSFLLVKHLNGIAITHMPRNPHTRLHTGSGR